MLYEPVSTNAFMLKVNVANCSCEWLETFKSLLFCSCLPLLCQNMYHTHLKKTWHMYQEVCRSQHACNTIVSCSYRVSSQVWNMNSVCISNTQHDIAMVSNKLKQVETSWNKFFMDLDSYVHQMWHGKLLYTGWLLPHEQCVQSLLHRTAHSLVGEKDRKDMTCSWWNLRVLDIDFTLGNCDKLSYVTWFVVRTEVDSWGICVTGVASSCTNTINMRQQSWGKKRKKRLHLLVSI